MAREIHVTPKGYLFWSKVLGAPQENKDEPSKPRYWSCELRLPMNDPTALALVQKIENFFYSKVGTGAKVSKNGWPFAEVTDENEQPTGILRFRFKRNESDEARTRYFSPPQIVDAKRNPWPNDVLIGNQSVGKVAWTWWTWKDKYGKDGISLSLEGIQVLDLVPYGGFNASDTFAEEEGYTVPGAAAQSQQEEERDPNWAGPLAGDHDEEEIPF